jgi:mRNA interferase MazF
VAAKRQGQIWWASLPEPLGWRPVLILTRTDAISRLDWVTVAPLTRKIRGIPSEVVLTPVDGVPQECAANLDNVATIEKELLTRQIATLPEERMRDVWDALQFAFGIPQD